MEVLGRENELETLTAFLDRLREGAAGFVVEGEPGIGKTTLWDAGVATARGRGYGILASRPVGSEVQLSFAALGDLLEDVLDETFDELPGPQRRALEVALLREDPRDRPPDQRAIAVAVLGALRSLATTRPVLVAVDDAQWLDRPTAAVLEFALRRLRSETVGVLVTVKSGTPADALELERALPVERVRLGPLDAAAIHRIVRERLDVALPRPLLLRVHETSRGNPFHALELARAGDPFAEAGSQDLVRTRVAALPADVQELLLVVALLSDPTFATVEATVEHARASTDAAVAEGLLERDGDRIRFRHPLLATAVSSQAEVESKRRVHRRLARVVEDPEARARHLALGAGGPDIEVAAELDDAAHGALARGAPSAAAELLELAIELTPPGHDDALRRGKLAASEAHFSSGSLARGTAILRALLDELPQGDERADVLLRLAQGTHDLEETVELALRAQREVVDDDAVRSRVHLLLGQAWPLRGMASALEDGRLALDFAEHSGERRLILDVAARLSLWELWAGRDPSELLERAVALERPEDGLRSYQSPRMPLALQHMYQGRLADARELFHVLFAEAVALGDEVAALAVRGRLVEVALRAGEWADADAHAVAAFELAEQIGLEHDGGLAVYRRALVAAHLGRVDEARTLAKRGADLAAAAKQENTRVMNESVAGFLELSLGNDAAALPHLEPFLDWVSEKQLALAPHLPATYAIDALAAAGYADDALSLVDLLEQEAHASQSPWAQAIAARCRGVVNANEEDLASALTYDDGTQWPFEQARTLLALGRVQRRGRQKAAAKDSLERALAIFEELPAPLWADQARDELSRIGLRRAAPGELTASERRVAELAATGLTNREVAARLFMSPKTVEANVARAYRKLGIRSRAELGARLADTQDAAQT